MLGANVGIAVLHKLRSALFAHDAEAPGNIIELTDQFDHHQYNLPESPVGCFDIISGQLASCFLHGSNGGSGRNTAGGTTGGNIPVAGNLFQFVNLFIQDGEVDTIQGPCLDRQDAVLAQIALDMDEVFVEISVFFFVYFTIRTDEVPWASIDQQVLHDRLITPIDVLLCGLANVNVSEAAGSSLNSKQRIKHKWV